MAKARTRSSSRASRASTYEYLSRQFHQIKSGRRKNADETMVKQIRDFSERDIVAVVDYTSRLRPPAEISAPAGWRNPDFPADFTHIEADRRRVSRCVDETDSGEPLRRRMG